MAQKIIDLCVKIISERSLGDGGFSSQTGGQYRADATGWAVFVLAATAAREDLVQSGRSVLVREQKDDGSVCVSDIQPMAFWPTPLAVMAWHGSLQHQEAQTRAIKFLLDTTGRHFKKEDDSIYGHDTTIRGWPWIANTHSWVEPTSMVLLALELTGNGGHERAQEARRMLLDRQLESGGWNYGNTTVFGTHLRPMPESTGLALSALAGRVSREVVGKSLRYLKEKTQHLRTPLSLGWDLLGLAAWDAYPPDAESRVKACFDRQRVHGAHDTCQLSLLLASLLGKRGILSLAS